MLDEACFTAWCVAPVAAMVRKIRAVHPNVPIIGFPKGAGSLYTGYREQTGVTALGLDWSVPWSRRPGRWLQAGGAVQGIFDPLRLVAGGAALRDGVDAILTALGDGPLVFNLGHGITPDGPISHVAEMVERVRNSRR